MRTRCATFDPFCLANSMPYRQAQHVVGTNQNNRQKKTKDVTNRLATVGKQAQDTPCCTTRGHHLGLEHAIPPYQSNKNDSHDASKQDAPRYTTLGLLFCIEHDVPGSNRSDCQLNHIGRQQKKTRRDRHEP